MIEVNLLGEKNKKIWMLHNLIRIASFLGCAAAVLMLIFSGALFAYNKKIEKSLNITKNNINILKQTGLDQEQNMKKEIDKVNAKIYFLGSALKNHREISPAIEELSSVFSSGISVSSIDFQANGDNYLIAVKGNSASRADFLKLQSVMEKNTNFSNIKSPLSNIAKKENINFVITADIRNNISKK